MHRWRAAAAGIAALLFTLRCGSDDGGGKRAASDAGSDGAKSEAGADGPETDATSDGPGPGGSLVPRPPYAYPSADPTVCHVPVAEKLELQNYLDDVGGRCPSHKVRLDGADYRSGGLSSLTIKSGYEIYGLPGMGENGVFP